MTDHASVRLAKLAKIQNELKSKPGTPVGSGKYQKFIDTHPDAAYAMALGLMTMRAKEPVMRSPTPEPEPLHSEPEPEPEPPHPEPPHSEPEPEPHVPEVHQEPAPAEHQPVPEPSVSEPVQSHDATVPAPVLETPPVVDTPVQGQDQPVVPSVPETPVVQTPTVPEPEPVVFETYKKRFSITPHRYRQDAADRPQPTFDGPLFGGRWMRR